MVMYTHLYISLDNGLYTYMTCYTLIKEDISLYPLNLYTHYPYLYIYLYI